MPKRRPPARQLVSDRGAELDAALAAARGASVILAAAGAAIAHNEGRPSRAPTVADLGAAALPFEAVQEAVRRSSAAVGGEPLALMAAPFGDPANGAALPPMPGGLALYWVWLPVRTARPDLAPSPDPEHPGGSVETVHAAWLAADPRPLHPLAPLVDAWQRWREAQPPVVEHETRADRRIMPALRVIGPSTERERGRLLFGGLLDGRPHEADLVLFPELEPVRHRVPLLEIAERTGLPFRSRGKGAPVPARLVVRGGLLNLRPEDRGRPVVRIAVTVGELLDALWPPSPGRGRPRDAVNWPKLLDALYRARDFHVPDAAGGRWFPLALRRLPANAESRPRPARADLIVLDLAPVPGAETGASVDLPALDRMGVTSGPRWFAYLAGRSLIWRPGVTRRPVPKTGRYGWSGNPGDYPVLTLADLQRFAFGGRDEKHRTRADILGPWEKLPDLALLPNQTDARTAIRGYRLLPTEADAALLHAREGGRNRGVSGRNRGKNGRNRGKPAP